MRTDSGRTFEIPPSPRRGSTSSARGATAVSFAGSYIPVCAPSGVDSDHYVTMTVIWNDGNCQLVDGQYVDVLIELTIIAVSTAFSVAHCRLQCRIKLLMCTNAAFLLQPSDGFIEIKEPIC